MYKFSVLAMLLFASAFEYITYGQNFSTEYSIVSELENLSNFENLPQYNKNSKNLQISSYDRKGGNDDGFNGTYSYLRRNTDSTLVIFDHQGRGIIDRIWTPTPTKDTLDFYIGDTAEISFSIAFEDLFSGKVYPFIQPLCGNEIGGYYSYLPIPFNKGCKIVFRGKKIRFLQIQYRALNEDAIVKEFSLNLDQEEKLALKNTSSVWSGEKIVKSPGTLLQKTLVSLKPGSTKEIFSTNKGGRIVGLEIDNANLFEGNLNNIDIRISYDDEKYPAIYAPLADFFGYAFGKASMQSIVSGTKNNTNYCFLPMPFDGNASIEIISRGANKELVFTARVFYTKEKRDKKREGKLYLQWNKLLESTEGKEMTMANVTGKGHYVGTIMQTQNLKPGMTLFFEGDDIAIIDGENTIHGTGSEDYFNGGWYAFLDTWDRGISMPIHGSLDYSLVYGRTGAYRWHLTDKISFNHSLNYVMEHGPEGNMELVNNTSLGFYYCDTPKQFITEPSDKLSKVFIPEIYMLYPQMMKLNLWMNIKMTNEWCGPSGGFTYIFEVTEESKLRVSLDEIPTGKYKLYLDYKEIPEGCEVIFWQRQNQISKAIDTYSRDKNRVAKLYVCDIVVSDMINTITFSFKTKDDKNKFLLNRLIFEIIE